MNKAHYRLSDFPDRKVVGKNYVTVCPECGKKKLHINIKTGLFYCFYGTCNCRGILQDFKAERLPEYVIQAGKVAISRYQGRKGGDGSGEEMQVPMTAEDYKPLSRDILGKIVPITAEETGDPVQLAARQYLADQQISLQTAVDCQLGCVKKMFPKSEKDASSGAVYNSIAYVNHVNGKAVNVKYRSCERSTVDRNPDGNGLPVYLKLWSQDSPTTPCAPYNIDCINPLLVEEEQIERIIITEGEKDVLTLREAGFKYVVSLPNGASCNIRNAFEAFESWFDQSRNIVVCGDSDRPGRTAAMKLLAHFGARGLYTTLPADCKDISEVMVRYGAETVREVINSARLQHLSDIVKLDERRQRVIDVLHGHYDKGYDVGHGPLTDKVLHPTDTGGLIIVTGLPNAGKTDFLNDLMCRLMARKGKSVCFLSFEKPDKEKHYAQFVKLMMGQSNTCHYPAEDFQPILGFLNRHMAHLNLHEAPATPDNVIERAEALMRERPLHYLVIDPYLYMAIDFGRTVTETQAIKNMLSRLQSWGHEHHIWVVIVAHPTKLPAQYGNEESPIITMHTIAGSANWGNMGDFILSIERVKKDDRDFTRMKMLKVRDQDDCRPGEVFYVRQQCGRYDERENEQQIVEEALGKVLEKDTEPWIELTDEQAGDETWSEG